MRVLIAFWHLVVVVAIVAPVVHSMDVDHSERENKGEMVDESSEKQALDYDGYVYMNVLGRFRPDMDLVVLKVGKADTKNLGSRMYNEYRAADALGLGPKWTFTSTPSEEASTKVWIASFKFPDSVPYLRVPKVATDEDIVRELWIKAAGGKEFVKDDALKWLASFRNVNPKDIKDQAKTLGANTELVVVPGRAVELARAAAAKAGVKEWTMELLAKALEGFKLTSDKESVPKNWADLKPLPVEIVKREVADLNNMLLQLLSTRQDMSDDEAKQFISLCHKQFAELAGALKK